MAKKNISETEWQGRFSHQKAILFDESDFSSKGTKFQVIKITPGGKIDSHFHKIRTEVFYVLKGAGIITLGNEKVSCSAHDYMLCKPDTVHAFDNEQGTEDFVIAVFRTNDPGDSDMLWVNPPTATN